MEKIRMKTVELSGMIAVVLTAASAAVFANGVEQSKSIPAYAADGRLIVPADYREWVFLSSGIDMSYSDKPRDPGTHVFDNVFVEPGAYRSFLSSGIWPDKTVMVLEVRSGQTRGSINKAGQFQVGEPLSMELHVKDSARFTGGWAFFDADGSGYANQLPVKEECYACHLEHAAVDTTFVQFYPTLLPLAEKKGTLSAAYIKERNGVDAAKPAPK